MGTVDVLLTAYKEKIKAVEENETKQEKLQEAFDDEYIKLNTVILSLDREKQELYEHIKRSLSLEELKQLEVLEVKSKEIKKEIQELRDKVQDKTDEFFYPHFKDSMFRYEPITNKKWK